VPHSVLNKVLIIFCGNGVAEPALQSRRNDPCIRSPVVAEEWMRPGH